MILGRHAEGDYAAVRDIYASAFKRPDDPERNPPEVDLFEALVGAGDVVDELSFVALDRDGPIGHVTSSRATVGVEPVVAVGPIGVLPEHQGRGTGTALMHAMLGAAEARAVPLVVLLGAPRYYGRFGFRPAAELGVTPPEPQWGEAFQARALTAYDHRLQGPFTYAPAFSS